MLLAVGVAAAACSASAGLPAALTLRPGDTEIVVAADAPKTVRFAAEEMQALLSQAFGESVPLVDSPTKGKRGIFLGDSAAARVAGIAVARLPRDGYRIKTAKNAVFIAGRDDPGVDAFARAKSDGVSNLYYERGTLFGVYEFLERFAGMRFYFPGELGTIVPKAAKIDVPPTDISDAPDFTVRMVSYFWDGKQTVPEDASLRGNSFKTINCYRMRFQTESIVCSHGQNGFRIPERFAATNPEYFQLRKDGTRCLAVDSDKGCVYCRQLCQSSAIWDEIWKDVQSYLITFQGFSQDLMMLMSNLMQWKFRLPRFLSGAMKEMVGKQIHEVLTKNEWKDEGVRRACVAVRKYQAALGYSEAWMTEYVHAIVMLAKKEPRKNSDE